MRSSRYTKVVAALAVVALSSGVIGAAIALWVERARAEAVAAGGMRDGSIYLARLAKTLELTPEQKRQIEPIFERGTAATRALTKSVIEQTGRIRRQMRDESWPLLTSQQREKLDAMERARIERRQGTQPSE